jgi:DNA-binding MarR family transcriptional regulator
MHKNTEGFGAWLKLDKPEQMVGFLLRSLHHTLRQSVDEALRKQGVELSFAHFAALFGLQCEPGATGAQLARRALVSAQTMNSALRRLELDGRIERRPHPDSRRADSWTLTADGVADLNRARQVCGSLFEKMLAPLNATEIAALQDYLRRCIAALEANTGPREASVEPPKRRSAKHRPAKRGARPAAAA